MTDPYVVLVTGPRDYTDRFTVEFHLMMAFAEARMKGRPLVVRHGACPGGADLFADQWGNDLRRLGKPVSVDPHPARNHPTEDFGPWPWAGPNRNTYMTGLRTDVCLAFIGPCTRASCRRPRPHDSHGTADCARKAEAADIPTQRILPSF